MNSTEHLSPAQDCRVRLAAISMAALTPIYVATASLYFYEDFFKFDLSDPLLLTPSGLATHISGDLWTVMSFWRLPMVLVTTALLAACAVGLYRRNPRARVWTLLTLWGGLFPQLLWAIEFFADWHADQGLGPVMIAFAIAVLLPSALLVSGPLRDHFEGRDTLNGWASLRFGRKRLFAATLLMAWLAFFATEFMDHAQKLPSDFAFLGALTGLAAAAVAAVGMVRLRTWALWVGLAAVLLVSAIPLASLWTPYQESVQQRETVFVYPGHFEGSDQLTVLTQDHWVLDEGDANREIDTICAGSLDGKAGSLVWALLPLMVYFTLTGPFLRAFVSKLRQ